MAEASDNPRDVGETACRVTAGAALRERADRCIKRADALNLLANAIGAKYAAGSKEETAIWGLICSSDL